MTLKEILPPDQIVSPYLFYEGEWILTDYIDSTQNIIYGPAAAANDTLALNAKVIGKRNLYLEFLEKNYFKPLSNILASESLAHEFYPQIIMTDANGVREAHYWLEYFYLNQVIGMRDAKHKMAIVNEALDNNQKDKLGEIVKQLHRDERKIITDVKENGYKSPYFNEIYKVYIEQMLDLLPPDRNSFENYLEMQINTHTKLIVSSRYFASLFQRKINFEELTDAFDYDTFCLITAERALYQMLKAEELDKGIDSSIEYISNYLNAVAVMRQQRPNYNPQIIKYDYYSKQKQIVTLHDIEKAYNAYLSRHPDFYSQSFEKDDLDELLRNNMTAEEYQNLDLKSAEGRKKVEKIISLIKSVPTLMTEWDILPKGEAFPDEPYSPKTKSNSNSPTSLPEDEKIRRMVIGRNYLEESNYLYKLCGTNKFDGYIGYIYSNGVVIFEKFYENIKTKKVASGSATYRMTISNFVEMTQKSKYEIIQLINSDSTVDIQRIYHGKNMDRWKSQIAAAIYGAGYPTAVIDYINKLIDDKKIKQQSTLEVKR